MSTCSPASAMPSLTRVLFFAGSLLCDRRRLEDPQDRPTYADGGYHGLYRTRLRICTTELEPGVDEPDVAFPPWTEASHQRVSPSIYSLDSRKKVDLLSDGEGPDEGERVDSSRRREVASNRLCRPEPVPTCRLGRSTTCTRSRVLCSRSTASVLRRSRLSCMRSTFGSRIRSVPRLSSRCRPCRRSGSSSIHPPLVRSADCSSGCDVL